MFIYMDKSKTYKIGYVARSHGLKGEVTIMLGPECPDLGSVKSLFVETGGELVPFFVQSVSVRGTKAFLKLEEVNTPERAEALKGSSLYLPKTERPKLDRGDFYSDEVIGFEVSDAESGELGTVSDVLENGPIRYLSLQHNGKEVMIPVNGPFIKSINKTKKKIQVALPEGFLDI
jgi:16S rRNA processing protein RimM